MKQYTQEGRITSLFGILMPPKKFEKVGKHITITFMIKGTIPSKKNHIFADSNLRPRLLHAAKLGSVKEVIDYLRDNVYSFVKNSKRYLDWEEEVKGTITEQAAYWQKKFERYGLVYPISNCSMKVYHYWTDKKERDLSNKIDSIQDMLVKRGVLSNDCWQVLHPICSDGEDYSGQMLVPVTRVDLSIRLDKV